MDKQLRLQLKRKSHALKPVVMIAGNGLSKSVHQEIETALEHHELIKIRISGANANARDAMVQTICDTHQATLINQIGHVIVVYRKRD